MKNGSEQWEQNVAKTYQVHEELLMPLVHDVVVLSTPHKLAQQLLAVLVLQGRQHLVSQVLSNGLEK